MRKNVRNYIIAFTSIIFLFAIIEIMLRAIWGFGNTILYKESPLYEYIAIPNQDIHRFGNHISYNNYSQRSCRVDSSKTIILGLGDSVINGGVLTDDENLATTLASNDSIQILNISSGSWGPDNCAAYLKENGLFNAKKMLLVVSSHDAYDNMSFEHVVDVHKSYPSHQYLLGLVELFDRYLIPRIIKKGTPDPDSKVLNGIGIKKNGKYFNPGFSQLKAIADSANIELVLYLHPDISEIKANEFNEQGKEIIDWANREGIKIFSGFEEGENIDSFRDGIHLNNEGQLILSKWMKKVIN